MCARASDVYVLAPLIAASPRASQVDVSGYGIVYVPGGHGAMVDLPDNAPLQQLLAKARTRRALRARCVADPPACVRQAWSQGAVLAAVCHGPAALVRVTDPATGAPLLRGKRVSAFTNEGAARVWRSAGVHPPHDTASLALTRAAEEEQSGLAQTVPWLLEDAVKQSGGLHEKTTPW